MQLVVNDEKKEQESIINSKNKAVKEADQKMTRLVKAAEDKMRRAIEFAQNSANQAIKAAKKEADEMMKAAEALAEKKELQAKRAKGRKLAAMRKDIDCLPLLRQIYNEAPDDVLGLILSKCSDEEFLGIGMGGLNPFRLANKRLMKVVESFTTKLTDRQEANGRGSLPVPIIQRCRRVAQIICCTENLRSLEGCPCGLRRLKITSSPHLSDLSPLASCSMMESLCIGSSSIKDLSPLSSCPVLKTLHIMYNRELMDLSPLSSCANLQFLKINHCPFITNLAPLSALINLKELYCNGINSNVSVLPLTSCSALNVLGCSEHAADLGELCWRMPQLTVETPLGFV